MLAVSTLTIVPLFVDTVNMSSSTRSNAAANQPYHHGRLREALVDAALELARSGGPEAVVLRAVSREAGVSHNAAYRHFADQQDLLAAVSARCMDRLAALMSEGIDAVTARGRVKRAWAELEATGRAYIEFALTEPGWFRTAFAPAQVPFAPKRGVDDGARGPYEILSARLDELVEVGALPADRRPRAEYAAWSMVHGLSSLLVEGPLRGIPNVEVSQAVRSVLAVVQRGL
jgi:AcrR family transcriptional regulator